MNKVTNKKVAVTKKTAVPAEKKSTTKKKEPAAVKIDKTAKSSKPTATKKSAPATAKMSLPPAAKPEKKSTPVKKSATPAQQKKPVKKSVVAVEKKPVKKTVATKKASLKKTSITTPKDAQPEKIRENAGPSYRFSTDIPQEYGETYMRALPRDPEWTYVYWEFTPATISSLKKYIGAEDYDSSRRILRLHDITDVEYNGSNSWHHFDIEINVYANTWFLKIPEPARTYIVECGHITADGKFFLIIRSNIFSVPKTGISPINDEEWSTVSTDELIAISANALKGGIGSSERNAGITPGVSSPGGGWFGNLQ
jgi:hypothetical protein